MCALTGCACRRYCWRIIFPLKDYAGPGSGLRPFASEDEAYSRTSLAFVELSCVLGFRIPMLKQGGRGAAETYQKGSMQSARNNIENLSRWLPAKIQEGFP